MPSYLDDYLLLSPTRDRQRQFLHRIALVLFAFSIIFVIFFIIASYINEKYTKPSRLNCKKTEYDYDILAVRWTPTFCASRKCVNATEHWNIHGLWPSWSNNSLGPQFCCRVWGFSRSELIAILPQLKQEWPNQLAKQGENSLWKHEWLKHGTCSTLAQSGGMMNYFNSTLSLFTNYPIESWLVEDEINPTHISGPAYTLEKVHQAIESKIGKNISIQCVKSSETEFPLIETINLCFHPKTMAILDCRSGDAKCGKKGVILPQIVKSND